VPGAESYLIYASMIAANIIATRAFATHAGPGMAAAFDYCLRCISVVVAYLVYPVANSLLPEIARLRGINRTAQAYRLLDKSLGLMAVAATVACTIGLLLRSQAISLLFERGSFTGESTLMVSRVFLGFAPAIVAWALLDLMSRCFFALDRPRMPVAASFIPIAVNLIFMMLLGHVKNPALLSMGASTGLTLACIALFTTAHLKRRAREAVPEAVQVG
jgi:putative peptidoglycan lipid II flippase